jgi:hypothetical protein
MEPSNAIQLLSLKVGALLRYHEKRIWKNTTGRVSGTKTHPVVEQHLCKISWFCRVAIWFIIEWVKDASSNVRFVCHQLNDFIRTNVKNIAWDVFHITLLAYSLTETLKKQWTFQPILIYLIIRIGLSKINAFSLHYIYPKSKYQAIL